MTHLKQKTQQSGFALLITILVLSVVVAVTLAIVELSLKQLKLSVDSTDSESAFHAANAGLECARYLRRVYSDEFETGASVPVNCFGNPVVPMTKQASVGFVTNPVNPNPSTEGQINRYKRDIDWGTGPGARCTSIDITTIVATTSITIGATLPAASNLKNFINGYENAVKTCEAGERCTIISVVGYSSVCSAQSASGVLKREILLEL